MYELIVRKTCAKFLENIIKHNNVEINHDDFKAVVYDERPYKTTLEEKVKGYYDGYMYLLYNSKNFLSRSTINNFFMLMNLKKDSSKVESLIQLYFYLTNESIEKRVSELVLGTVKIFEESSKIEKMLISLMLFNYELVKNNMPTVSLSPSNLKAYEKIESISEMTEFLSNIITNSLYVSEEYIKNLKPLDIDDICKEFKNDEEILKEKFYVKKLLIHGSFAKGTSRIDSDIDLLVEIDKNLAYGKRLQIIEELKIIYFEKFKRFIDIQEVSFMLPEEFIKEAKTILIFKEE